MTPKSYFKNIFDNVSSIAIGMKITIKYCFQKTVTVQYPEQHLTFAPRYRGIHEFEADKCIACDMCAKACPVDCIYIDKTGARKIDKKTGKVDPKGGQLLRFAIDYSKCLFCALCTEPCPTTCIHMGKLHDLSSYTREDVVVEFADDVFARVAAQVVQLAHVDAGRRARLGAQRAEQALAVIDREPQQLAAL